MSANLCPAALPGSTGRDDPPPGRRDQSPVHRFQELTMSDQPAPATAAERMRDRIADFLHAEGLKRTGNTSRKDALLFAMERLVRAMPADPERVAHD